MAESSAATTVTPKAMMTNWRVTSRRDAVRFLTLTQSPPAIEARQRGTVKAMANVAEPQCEGDRADLDGRDRGPARCSAGEPQGNGRRRDRSRSVRRIRGVRQPDVRHQQRRSGAQNGDGEDGESRRDRPKPGCDDWRQDERTSFSVAAIPSARGSREAGVSALSNERK